MKLILQTCLLVFIVLGFTCIANAAINPSWPYCENNAGRGEIREDADRNQYSVCVFADGSECDAFAFYYGKCSPASTELVWKGSGKPSFDDYPARIDQYAPTAKQLDLDEGLAYLFGLYEFTGTLKETLQTDSDFAGNSILTSFGHCGNGCQNFVIVDQETGKVTMPELTLFDGSRNYQSDSRLLILDGMLNEDPTQVGTHYFVWSNGALLPLKVQK